MQTQTALQSGNWGEHMSWELFLTHEMPPTELVTAVSCVAITNEGKVVLARPKRGWGLLGGHIEDGEQIQDALVREAQEEGGFTPLRPQLFAVRKVIATQLVPHPEPAKHYPYPVSYLAYYWATTDLPMASPTGSEIIESASFTLDEIRALGTPDLLIIEKGYQAFQEYLEQSHFLL